MIVLMAEKVDQDKIAVDILSSLSTGMEMVNLEFFPIEESFTAFWASTMLSLGEFLFGGCQVLGCCGLSFHPVALETRIVGGGCSFDEPMSLNREPTEFEEIGSCLFVTKHPRVLSFWMQLAPIALMPPRLGFSGMCAPGVVVLLLIHPSVQAAEDFFGYSNAEVVRPSSDHWIQLPQNGLYIHPLGFFPEQFQFRSDLLYCFFAGFDEEFPSGPRGKRRRVMSDIEAKEVETLGEVNDSCFLLRKSQTAFF